MTTSTSSVIDRVAPFEITTDMEIMAMALAMPPLAYLYLHVWIGPAVYQIIAGSFMFSAVFVFSLLCIIETYQLSKADQDVSFDPVFDSILILSMMSTTGIIAVTLF
jgi:hypothetical protein